MPRLQLPYDHDTCSPPRVMSNTTSFLSYASSKNCRNDDALVLLREKCSKQSSISREGEYHDRDDASLLPTSARLRAAFPTSQESHTKILNLLNCDCDLCKPQHNALEDTEREKALPSEILGSDDNLKSFATLILSGCLFAWREFMRSEDESLQRFDRRLRSNPGLRLRRRLFRFASEAQCSHDEEIRAGTPLPQQCLTCVASTFRDCVRWKFRLQSVKTVRRSDKIEDYFLSDINLPLVLEHEDQIDKPRKPGLRFSRCRIEPTHCQSEELTVCSIRRVVASASSLT